jgi:competence ComEA-like helix-hairpin-helix protein
MNAPNPRHRTTRETGRRVSAPLAACGALAGLLAASGALPGLVAANIVMSAQQPAVGSAQQPAAPAASPDQPAAAQPESDAKGAATFARVCSLCHDGARILSNRRSKSQWTEVIEKMMERGAQVSEDDFTDVMDYLLRHYGRINVNKAAAEDLALVVGVSKKDAEAIVSYRDSKGDFPDFDALAKVPGIDVEKLNKGRDAITF